jgi:hypothetical protein
MSDQKKLSASGICYDGYASVCSMRACEWTKRPENKERVRRNRANYYERNKEALKAKRRARYAAKKALIKTVLNIIETK